MAIYLEKVKEKHKQELLSDGRERKISDVLRYDMYWDKPPSPRFLETKFGHIEVGVVEYGDRHFAERLEQFLVEAVKLYDKIVLGNTDEFRKKVGLEIQKLGEIDTSSTTDFDFTIARARAIDEATPEHDGEVEEWSHRPWGFYRDWKKVFNKVQDLRNEGKFEEAEKFLDYAEENGF